MHRKRILKLLAVTAAAMISLSPARVPAAEAGTAENREQITAYSEETKDQEEGSREGMPLLEDTAEHPPAEEGGPPARESPPGTEEVTDIPADSISITIDDGASSGAEDISADNPEDIFNTTEDLSPDGSEETAYDTGSDLSVSADREGAVFCAADAGADEQNPAADADTRDDTAKDGLTDEEDGHTYYYKDGARQTGFVSHDGMVLYFDEDGRMVRGQALIDGTLFWFHEDTGDMARSSWVRHDGGMYYYDSDGHAAAGFNDIGGKLYFFDTDGRKQDFRGWETINGTAYYFDADGAAVTGIANIEGKKYAFNKDGSAAADLWVQDGGRRYRTGADGRILTGWNSIDGRRYYMDDDGAVRTGWQEINGKKYYMDKNGAALTGWKRIGTRVYFFSDGRASSYKSSTEGAMLTGWQRINGRKYYFADDRYSAFTNAKLGIVLGGFKTVGGKNYYFMNEQCSDFSNGKLFYFTDRRIKSFAPYKEGTVLSGSVAIGGNSYHISDTGAVTTGVFRKNGSICFYDASGKKKTGWVTSGSSRYYIPANGRNLSGWTTIDGKKYYFNSADNSVKTRAQIIGDRICYFGNNGVYLPRYTRDASPLLPLSKENREKALIIIGKYLDLAVNSSAPSTLYSRSDLKIADFEKIREAVNSIYYNEPYNMNIPSKHGSLISYSTEGAKKDGYVSYVFAFCSSFVKEDIDVINEFRAVIDENIRQAGIKESDSDRVKAEKISSQVCRVLRYDYDRYYGHSTKNDTYDRVYGNSKGLIDCIRDRLGVCYDYSEFYYAMCTKAGLRCQMISGGVTSSSQEHMWNRVLINGSWKYIDTTWNDDYGENKWYFSDSLWWDHYSPKVAYDNRK